MTLKDQLSAYLSALRRKAALKIPKRKRVESAKIAARARWENKPPVCCPVCGDPHPSNKSLAAHRRTAKACKAKRGRPRKKPLK